MRAILVLALIAMFSAISPSFAEPKEAPAAWPYVKQCLETQVGLKHGKDADFWQLSSSDERRGGVQLKGGLVAELRSQGRLDQAVACLKAGQDAKGD